MLASSANSTLDLTVVIFGIVHIGVRSDDTEFHCSKCVPFYLLHNGSSCLVIAPQTNNGIHYWCGAKHSGNHFCSHQNCCRCVFCRINTTITQQQQLQQHSATAAHNNIYIPGQQQQYHLTTAAHSIISTKQNSTIHTATVADVFPRFFQDEMSGTSSFAFFLDGFINF